MSSTAAVVVASVGVIYFHTFFIAYLTSAFIRLAFVIVAFRLVRRRKANVSRTSQIWRISPKLTNIVFGSIGRFLSVKTSLFYNQNQTTHDSPDQPQLHSSHGPIQPKCCVTQIKFECFRIMSTQVKPFSTTRSSFAASRSALLEIDLRDLVFKINITIQICDNIDQPESKSFLRLFNRRDKRNCVTVSLHGELHIGILQIFLFHPSLLSRMANRVSEFITGSKKSLKRIKSPFSILFSLFPALDVHGLTFKIRTDVEYPTGWTNAEGANVVSILKLDTLSLRMPDPVEGSDPRVILGLPHQLAANSKEQPSNIVSGIKDFHVSVTTKLKQSMMDSNSGSDVFIPSLLFDMHLQPKRDLTSYLASIELCGDKMDEHTNVRMTRKEDAANISITTGSCQIMSGFVILRRTWKPLLVELDAMRHIVITQFPQDLVAVNGKHTMKKRAISLVLFKSTLGVRIGLDDDRKSPLRLTLASGVHFNWSRKEIGVIRSQTNLTGKYLRIILKDLRLGHQRCEGEIFHLLKIDESCVDIGPIESNRQRTPTNLPSSSGDYPPRILNAMIGSMIFHVYEPTLMEEFFRFVGSFYSALAYTRPPLKSSAISCPNRDVDSRKGDIENVTLNLKLLDIKLSMAVNYDDCPTQEMILFMMHGTDGTLSIAPSKTDVKSEVARAKNSWINFTEFQSALEFDPHKSLPRFHDPRQPILQESDHRIKFYVAGFGLKIFVAPHEIAPSNISNKEGSRIDIMINSLSFKEYVVNKHGIIETETSILKSNGLSSLALRSSERVQVSQVESRLVSVLDIFIDFYGTALNVTWYVYFCN